MCIPCPNVSSAEFILTGISGCVILRPLLKYLAPMTLRTVTHGSVEIMSNLTRTLPPRWKFGGHTIVFEAFALWPNPTINKTDGHIITEI